MRNIKNHISKTLVFVLSIFIFVGMINVRAGYTYNSKGEPIYSTEGFVVNELPIDYNKLGIYGNGTPNPIDLFVYNQESLDDSLNNQLVPQRLYITDSNYHAVYVFDTEFNLEQTISKFRLDPHELYETNVTAIKTRDEASGSAKLVFNNSNEIPTEEELDDPNSEYPKYEGNGYIEINLNAPSCTYRKVLDSGKEYLYICDTGNNQIIVADYASYDEQSNTYAIYQVVTKPTEELDTSKEFLPEKVVVDGPGRMYVIAKQVLDGIMQFSQNGDFARYTGTNEITLSAWDIFWRNFATKAQRETMKTLYNTQFLSLVYYNDMIYTTSAAIENQDGTYNDKIMIKKINPSGKDTLRRNGYQPPMGDVKYAKTSTFFETANASNKISLFVGITVNSYGTYSVLDKTKGRIFTYDNEGNLLYISGGQGIQSDKISKNPVAIQYFGDDILVLDKSNNTGSIIKFEPTEIATLINKAVKQEGKGQLSKVEPRYNAETKTWWISEEDTGIANEWASFEEKDGKWVIDGKETGIEVELGSTDYWELVVSKNANYEYAYVGIGHKYLKEGNYSEAMKYFELGKNKVYYSKAFKQYRDGIIKDWFSPVVIALVVLIVAKTVYKFIKNKKLGIKKVEETGVGDE